MLLNGYGNFNLLKNIQLQWIGKLLNLITKLEIQVIKNL